MNQLPDVDFVEYLEFIGSQESQHLTSLWDKSDEIEEWIENGELQGDKLPWEKTHNVFGFRPGEVTVWCGINGHGKSQLLGQVALWMIRDTKVCIISLEMPIRSLALRMMRQASGAQFPSREFRHKFYSWTDNRLWFYDQLDTIESDRILGVTHYVGRELGCKHVMIDSLMKCGIPADGNGHLTAQASFVDALTAASKACNTHTHLVHHVRKGETEEKAPGKFDLRGAAQIADMADNIAIIHRNKSKERRIADGEEVEDSEPDCTLTIAKQRHGEWEGRIALWFDAASQQYIPKPGGAMPWPDPNSQWSF